MHRAVFFDRDGVINHLVKHGDEYTAPWSLSEFKFIDFAKEAISLIKSLGYTTLVVTNQPDVNDGKLAASELNLMNKMIRNWLQIDDIFCAYERNTDFYKPNNGMIEFFVSKYKIDRSSSFLIGDRWKDIVAGHKSKLTTIYIGKEYTTPEEHSDIKPDYIVDSILQACTLIMELEKYD